MTAEPGGVLPLRPVEMQILVSLVTEDLHGYGIVQAVEARGEDRAVPGLVTLYRALERMSERGLVERVGHDSEHADASDHRRRTFRITALGRRVLHAEATRLSTLVRVALEASGPSGGGS